MRPGQQVVFRNFKGLKRDPNTIIPKDNTIVTLKERVSGCFKGFWRLVEYPLTVDGHRQAFHKTCLHPLISDAVLESELASIPETVLNPLLAMEIKKLFEFRTSLKHRGVVMTGAWARF